jgi:hypothetical protein
MDVSNLITALPETDRRHATILCSALRLDTVAKIQAADALLDKILRNDLLASVTGSSEMAKLDAVMALHSLQSMAATLHPAPLSPQALALAAAGHGTPHSTQEMNYSGDTPPRHMGEWRRLCRGGRDG